MRALLALAVLGGANAFAPPQQPRATLVRRHAIKVKVEVDIPALWDGAKEAAYKVGDLAGAVAGGGDASAAPPADPLAKINATVASIQRFPSDVEAKAAATAASVTKTIDDIQALPGRVTDKVDDTVDEAKRTAARIKSIPSRVRSSVDETTKSVTDAVDFVADLPARAQRTADGVTRTVTQTVETAEKTAAAVSGVASAVASAPEKVQALLEPKAPEPPKPKPDPTATGSFLGALKGAASEIAKYTPDAGDQATKEMLAKADAIAERAEKPAAAKAPVAAESVKAILADAPAPKQAPASASAPTAAEWRAACDASGVTSYADFGVALGSSAATAAGPSAPTGTAPTAAPKAPEKPAPAPKAPAAAPSPPKAADAAADAVALATRLRDAVVDVDNAAYGDKIAASFLASLVFLGVVIPTSPFTAPPPVPTTKREKRAAYVATELAARKNAPRPVAVDD